VFILKFKSCLAAPSLRATGVLCTIFLLSSHAPAQNRSPTPQTRFSLVQAVEQTLAADPLLKISREDVAASKGRLKSASGLFDPLFSSSVSHMVDERGVTLSPDPTAFSRLTAYETAYRVSLDQPTRSGILISPGFEVRRLDDNLYRAAPETRADVNLLFRIPLARGWGKNSPETLTERSTKMQLEAEELHYRQTVAFRLLNTVIAYWNYSSAQERLVINLDNENRAKRFLVQVEALVQADETPRAELDKLTANLASVVATREASETSVMEARQQLGLAVGMDYQQIPLLPPASDELLQLTNQFSTHDLARLRVGKPILDLRPDFAAAGKIEELARLNLGGARDQLKPQIDLILKVGYGGVNAGAEEQKYFTALGENVQGLNGFGAINFSFPFGNRKARGGVDQQQALLNQARIRKDELARSIFSEIELGMMRLKSLHAELDHARQARTIYANVVANEKRKLELGNSTVLDILQVEDRLTAASHAYLSTLVKYAVAVVRLRYEAGMLVTHRGGQNLISLESLTELPRIDATGD